MKQRLEPKDIQELTDGQKVRLRELWEPEFGNTYLRESGSVYCVKSYDGNYYPEFGGVIFYYPINHHSKRSCLPLLSIGQMIEIVGNGFFDVNDIDINELCDALWQAVKEIL